jgi:lactate racemase
MLPAPPYLLDVVLDARARAQAAVAGEVRQAFRVGAALCEPWFRVRAPASDLVIVSDGPPLTASLYQASKLVAACAPLVVDGGTVVLAAECDAGTGPVATVNEAIYRIGVAPRLPARHRVVLVSSLPREEVATTYCGWAPSVEEAVAAAGAQRPAVVLPRAGSLLVEREAA